MANLFDIHAKGLLRPLMGTTRGGIKIEKEQDVAELIARNMDRPVSAGTRLTNIWGTPDKFLSDYRNFNNLYQQMIEEELANTRNK
ncbi:MAG: hypothetical protein ACK5XN_32580 [Bacteroidota bacterium]|jgi:hypothetical protein